MSEYLTTKELAALLRIKERKVYDLASSGQVPCSKATGKLLFPRDQIEAWIARQQSGPSVGSTEHAAGARPNVVLGSHDPLLEWALRESRSGLATFFDGSADGLARLANREGVAAGLHLYDAEQNDWNTPSSLGGCRYQPVVVTEWARRQRGFIVSVGLDRQVRELTDLRGWRWAARQPEAGAQFLFETLRAQAEVAAEDIDVTEVARSEGDAALAVADGRADACFGLEALAAQFRLPFVPVIEERFDLVVDRHAWFEPPMQTFLGFCEGPEFRARARELRGYDVSGFGTIHFNGP